MLYTSMWMRLQKAFSFGTKFNSNADIRQAYVLSGSESICAARVRERMCCPGQKETYMFDESESIVNVLRQCVIYVRFDRKDRICALSQGTSWRHDVCPLKIRWEY